MAGRGFYLAITGGIGGAKLALGLSRILSPEALVLVVNTGDDFEHYGLHISPDVDTLIYTLGGQCNQDTGWGRSEESWTFMSALEALGGETWFQLGDKDLAMHVLRTNLLQDGLSLGEITSKLAGSFGIQNSILPMTNDFVQTKVNTVDGLLSFQHYFVRERCKPVVREILYDGASIAAPNPDIVSALNDENLSGVILCPSNPFLSIDPFLSIGGVRDCLRNCRAPIIAVSPLVSGKAIKGPLAKIMSELSIPVKANSIAKHYSEFLDGFVLDNEDREWEQTITESGINALVTNIVMRTMEDREQLARDCIELIDRLAEKPLKKGGG
ncbi:MAG: 2-phospho-L-lactate transferase [Woeseia sp.]|nr:2-phospho-L-lactate transferase [Woeseia sp.]